MSAKYPAPQVAVHGVGKGPKDAGGFDEARIIGRHLGARHLALEEPAVRRGLDRAKARRPRQPVELGVPNELEAPFVVLDLAVCQARYDASMPSSSPTTIPYHVPGLEVEFGAVVAEIVTPTLLEAIKTKGKKAGPARLDWASVQEHCPTPWQARVAILLRWLDVVSQRPHLPPSTARGYEEGQRDLDSGIARIGSEHRIAETWRHGFSQVLGCVPACRRLARLGERGGFLHRASGSLTWPLYVPGRTRWPARVLDGGTRRRRRFSQEGTIRSKYPITGAACARVELRRLP